MRNWLGLWTCWLLLLLPCAAAADPAALAAPLPAGASESLLDEPVFLGKVRVVESGQGNPETVVLIHGIGDAGARDWYGVLPALAKKYRVLAFDLPGFAGSDQANRSYTPLLYATFVKWLIDLRVRGPVTLVGHSLGGAVALRYASLWPQDCRRLVVVDAAGILYRSALFKELNTASMAKPGQSIWARGAKAVAGNLIQHLGKMPIDLGMIWGAETARRKLLGGASAKIAALALIDEQFATLFQRVTSPTVVLWGSADAVAPPRTGRLLASRLPDARLEVLQGLGHEPMHDGPKVFEDRLLAAIAGPLAPATPHPGTPTSERIGTCLEEKDKIFRGDYRRIDIKDCDRVRLVDVSARQVNIDDSDVTMENTRIEGPGIGIAMHDGELTATGLTVRTPVGLLVDDSQVDLAGADFVCSKAAVSANDTSDLLISASLFYSPWTRGGIAGIFALGTGQSL